MEFNLTDDQAKAVGCHQGPLCIVAGAGSGKSSQLAQVSKFQKSAQIR